MQKKVDLRLQTEFDASGKVGTYIEEIEELRESHSRIDESPGT